MTDSMCALMLMLAMCWASQSLAQPRQAKSIEAKAKW